MMSDSCINVKKHFSEIFSLTTCEVDIVRRQAWTVLLNMSCDVQCVDEILRSQVPSKRTFSRKSRYLFRYIYLELSTLVFYICVNVVITFGIFSHDGLFVLQTATLRLLKDLKQL